MDNKSLHNGAKLTNHPINSTNILLLRSYVPEGQTVYKSKTEVRFALTKSFSFIQKANVRYMPNPIPTVTKEI